jgi:hypothetical protein
VEAVSAATDNALADRLDALAGAVARLSPTRGAPERFFEDRDEIRCELRQLASERRSFPIA